MKKFKIGVQLYGLRHTMEKDVEGTLKALADMGYEYVELAGYYGKTSKEIKDILDKCGLKCVSAHQGIDFYNENPEEKAQFLKDIGVKYSIIPWYPKDELIVKEKRDEKIKFFNEKARFLKSQGMLLGYHNHEFEFEVADGKTVFDHIFDNVDKDLIFPEFDTCWVKYAGLDPTEMIRKFKGRVPVIHLKDFTCKKLAAGAVYDLIGTDGKGLDPDSQREDNGFRYCPLGRGMQDIEGILKACEECGTEYVIVEQDDVYDGMEELEAARLGREYLKEKFGL